MMHSNISLPESHPDYPALWKSDCGKLRIIRCKDDIQYIVQAWQSPKWRHLSYHVGWNSIGCRWLELDLPDTAPTPKTSQVQREGLRILSEIVGL